MKHDARQFELGIEAFNLAGEAVAAPAPVRHEAEQFQLTECCRYCGEPVTLHDTGVTFHDGCAHRDCAAAEGLTFDGEPSFNDERP